MRRGQAKDPEAAFVTYRKGDCLALPTAGVFRATTRHYSALGSASGILSGLNLDLQAREAWPPPIGQPEKPLTLGLLARESGGATLAAGTRFTERVPKAVECPPHDSRLAPLERPHTGILKRGDSQGALDPFTDKGLRGVAHKLAAGPVLLFDNPTSGEHDEGVG